MQTKLISNEISFEPLFDRCLWVLIFKTQMTVKNVFASGIHEKYNS